MQTLCALSVISERGRAEHEKTCLPLEKSFYSTVSSFFLRLILFTFTAWVNGRQEVIKMKKKVCLATITQSSMCMWSSLLLFHLCSLEMNSTVQWCVCQVTGERDFVSSRLLEEHRCTVSLEYSWITMKHWLSSRKQLLANWSTSPLMKWERERGKYLSLWLMFIYTLTYDWGEWFFCFLHSYTIALKVLHQSTFQTFAR